MSVVGGAVPARGVARGLFTVTRLHRSGVRPHRLLLVGSRALLSPRGLVQTEALGQRVADRVWLRTRRGVDLDMLWELRPVLAAMRDGLSSWRLWRYDAVIIVSGARAATIRSWWGSVGVGRLLRRVVEDVAAASHLLIVSVGDDDAHGSRRHRAARTAPPRGPVGRADGSRVVLLSASADPRAGAEGIAERLMAPLAAADAAAVGPGMDSAHRRRLEPDEEGARQRAVDALGLRDRRVERRLQHVVDLAQDAFESTSAEITIVDQDRQWTLAAAGRRRPDASRRTSVCSRSIERAAPTVIADVWRVPDLRGDPLLAGTDPVRFYAAHPIESIDGYRIGVLCVWDEVPRDVGDLDVGELRDFALLAEAEIIAANEER